MSERGVEEFCILELECEELIVRICEKFGLSQRGVQKVKKVAKTIADLDESETIKNHI